MSNITQFPPPADPSQTPGVVDTVTIEILATPNPSQIIKFMATLAKALNRQVGLVLAAELMSAANPACAGMCNAGASLESGAMQLDQLLKQMAAQQQAQAGMVMPGQIAPPGGSRGGGFTN